MGKEENVTSFLRCFTSAHKWAEEAGFQYTDNLLVDLVLGHIEKSDNQDYKIHALNYKAQCEQKKTIPFADIEQKFQNLDMNMDNCESHHTHHHAKMTSHTSYDTPSNKINKGPTHKKHSRGSHGKKYNKTDKGIKKSKGNRKCYVCGESDNIAPNCPREEMKAKWIAKRCAKAVRARAAPAQAREEPEEQTEYISAARIVFSDEPNEIILHNVPYGMTVSPRNVRQQIGE